MLYESQIKSTALYPLDGSLKVQSILNNRIHNFKEITELMHILIPIFILLKNYYYSFYAKKNKCKEWEKRYSVQKQQGKKEEVPFLSFFLFFSSFFIVPFGSKQQYK